MRLRVSAVVAACGIGIAALPAHAATATRPVVMTDPAGDANGLNDQGVVSAPAGFPENTASAPASVSAADILSVTFANTFAVKKVRNHKVRVPAGFTITMKLAAAPTVPSLFYRVAAAMPGCDFLYFEYTTASGDPKPGAARCSAVPPATNKPLPISKVTVVGDSIVWTLPVSAIRPGTTLGGLNAQTRGTAYVSTGVVDGGPTAPQLDYASTDKTFTVGR